MENNKPKSSTLGRPPTDPVVLAKVDRLIQETAMTDREIAAVEDVTVGKSFIAYRRRFLKMKDGAA